MQTRLSRTIAALFALLFLAAAHSALAAGSDPIYIYDYDSNTSSYIAEPPPIITPSPVDSMTYDDGNRQLVTDSVDASGSTITFYDSAGNAVAGEGVDATGQDISSISYDSATGDILTTDVTDNTMTVYDADGNVLSSDSVHITTPDETITTTLYDSDGEVIGTVDPLGQTTETFYDTSGNAISADTIDPLGRVTATTYDADNNALIVASDVAGSTTIYVYDQGSTTPSTYTTDVTDPNEQITTMTYDADSKQIVTTDALGKITTYMYDGGGIGAPQTPNIDPNSRVTTYAYDAVDKTLYAATVSPEPSSLVDIALLLLTPAALVLYRRRKAAQPV